jgi:hypothetical protein
VLGKSDPILTQGFLQGVNGIDTELFGIKTPSFQFRIDLFLRSSGIASDISIYVMFEDSRKKFVRITTIPI